MIFKGVECPDCGKWVSRSVNLDAADTPIWVCPECGTVHEDRSWYRYVSQDMARRIIEERKPAGLFVIDEGMEVIGIDNSTGDAWTEEFPDMIECLRWLLGEKEASE